MKSILVIDTGSSSIKGILFNLNSSIITKHSINHQMNIQNNYYATMEAKTFYESLFNIMTFMSEYTKENHIELSAIALTSQRSSVLPINYQGEPLSPIIMWYDKRSTDICDHINSNFEDKLYNICGMKLSPLCSAPKMLWIKRHEPQIYQDAYKLVGIHDYLLYLLTGKFVTDASCASRTCLMDIQKSEWSDDLIELFDLDKEKLCDIYAPGSIIGNLTTQVANRFSLPNNIPVISSGGDQQCSILGQGVYQQGNIGITSGTGCYVTGPIKTPITDSSKGLNLNVSCIPEQWILEATILASGSAYDWFNNNLYPESEAKDRYRLINKDISSISPGADGVLCFSNLMGKGTPHWDSHARGSFFNIGLDTTRAHMARALLEGICSEIYDCFQVLKPMIGDIKNIKVSGGLSTFTCFNQILVDMINCPVEVTHQTETTAVGAFMVASTTLNITSTHEHAYNMSNNSKKGTIYYPNLAANQIYNKQHEVRRYLKSTIVSSELRYL